MTNQDASRILTALAMQDPEYEALATDYRTLLDGAETPDNLPEDFPIQVLNLLREDPDTAVLIDRYEENLSHIQSYGPEDWLSPQLILAVLVLLSLRFRIRRNLNGKWSFQAGYEPLSAEALKPAFFFMTTLIGKTGEGLEELSKELSNMLKGQTSTDAD